MLNDVYYRRSGRFTGKSIVALFVVAPLLAAIAGFAYGVAVHYCPIVYINFLLTLGIGMGVGYVAFIMAKASHTRNMAMVVMAALLAGLVAEYSAFVGWVAAVVEWDFIIIDPLSLSEVAYIIGQHGAWGLGRSGGDPVSGWPLYIIWLIEAGVIVAMPVITAAGALSPLTYCERCHRWAQDKLTVGPFEPVADAAALRTNLEQGDFAALGSIAPLPDLPTEAGASFALFDMTRCPQCDLLHVLTIRNVALVEKDGKVQAKETVILENLLIDAESRQLITELAPAETPLNAEAMPTEAEPPTDI